VNWNRTWSNSAVWMASALVHENDDPMPRNIRPEHDRPTSIRRPPALYSSTSQFPPPPRELVHFCSAKKRKADTSRPPFQDFLADGNRVADGDLGRAPPPLPPPPSQVPVVQPSSTLSPSSPLTISPLWTRVSRIVF
jgi:hypothetical protein